MVSPKTTAIPLAIPWPVHHTLSFSISTLLQACDRIHVFSAVILFFLGWGIARRATERLRRRRIINAPPIVQIPESEIFNNPRAAFENALKTNGPIVGVLRKARLEYIVDASLTHEVLTNNVLFSFEDGTAGILNLRYFNNLFRSFFTEIDDMVRSVIISRMPIVIEQVGNAFMKQADAFMTGPRVPVNGDANVSAYAVDALEYTKRSIAEAMALIILGSDLCDEDILHAIDLTAHDMAVVTGIYQNTSRFGRTFPDLYRLFTWLKTLTTTLPRFYLHIGTRMWSKITHERYSAEEAKQDPELYKGSVLGYLARKHADPVTGKVGVGAYLHISALVLGIIFASVHQTASIAVWIIYQLAAHPEYIPLIRDEMHALVDVPSSSSTPSSLDSTEHSCTITYDALQRATVLDSFIREVMRTKGDTLSTARMTTRDVAIAGYTIPRGHLVLPCASLSHMSPTYHGPSAESFNGLRWVEDEQQQQGDGKSKSKGPKGAATINQTYFPFGLGRWACPGRVLAVSEMKMIIWSILARATPVLEGNTFNVPDPLNVTSTAPEGELRFVVSE